jgi:uncharacterized membrane protein
MDYAAGTGDTPMLWKVLFTIAVIWFVAGLIGLILHDSRLQLRALLVTMIAICTAMFVGYMWDFGNPLHFH